LRKTLRGEVPAPDGTNHDSIGASTAALAALGLMDGLQLGRRFRWKVTDHRDCRSGLWSRFEGACQPWHERRGTTGYESFTFTLPKELSLYVEGHGPEARAAMYAGVREALALAFVGFAVSAQMRANWLPFGGQTQDLRIASAADRPR
jgi:hypothetical protein